MVLKDINSFEDAVKKSFKVLSARTQKIMERRYGLFGKHPMTLEAIGKEEGITRERVRQIENDSLKRIKGSEACTFLDPAFLYLEKLLIEKGGVVAEYKISEEPEFGAPNSHNTALFLLEMCDFADRKKDTPHFHARWVHNENFDNELEEALKGFIKKIESENKAFSEEEFLSILDSHLCDYKVGNFDKKALLSIIDISKHLRRNVWDEVGHVSSPLVKPRGMKDEAYIILSKCEKPLHFTEIASRIQEANKRPVHTQTVHNELIKDDRFVLVGRGLYALKSWGYEPGFVKDVIINILQNKSAKADEIVEEVCKRRMVKKSTVLTNLQNREVFVLQDDGTYSIVS